MLPNIGHRLTLNDNDLIPHISKCTYIIVNKPFLSAEEKDFKPIEPVEFQDKLAEKCWNFVTEQTSGIVPQLKVRRNLVVIVKVCVMTRCHFTLMPGVMTTLTLVLSGRPGPPSGC